MRETSVIEPIRETSASRFPVLRGRKLRLVVLMIGAIGFAATFSGPLFRGNFGVIEEGRAYRSAQPGSELEETIRRLGLKSVVNLRGGSEDDPFYRDEVAAAKRGEIAFYDLPMSATARPSRRDLMRLLALYDVSPTPILIHCKSGSDRTGLAVALYRMDRLGEPPERAISGFSLLYGHVPLLGPERLHEPIDEYRAWLAKTGQTHTRQRFRGWIEREYRANDPFEGWPSIEPGRRAEVTSRPAEPEPR